ncbi:MAG: YwaF family protein [Oscillospiraceae bacterium]|nr:YwaF family protein [Oscillospiraceae bacterium]
MELWTAEHAKTLLPALAVMLVLAWVLQRVIGNKSHKIRMIPIQVIACLLLLLELGKQAVSLAHGYDLYHLPFHFCSLFIFMLPLMAFYKGKHKQTVYAITASLCMAVCALMLIYPALIYSDGNIREFFTNYISFHTVAFHNLVMLSAILIPVLKLHEPAKKGEHKAIVLFMLGFCTVSAVMAQLLKTNFNNFYRCNIPPLETVRQIVETAWGSVPAMLLYVLIVTILDILFVLGSYRLYLLVRRISQKEKAYTKYL